jgi:hypothetical protein
MNKMKLLFIIFSILSTISLAVPQKNLWKIWQENNSTSVATIDNSQYEKFLNKYISTNSVGVNLVAYQKVSTTDKRMLENYLNYLSTIKISKYNRNEQLSYWANLYNALTIDTILNNMPVNSILQIKLGRIFSAGPWNGKLIIVESNPISLNDIEHRIIRPIWNDSRTHYILNCASLSCPNIQKKPFSGKTIDNILNKAAIAYINSPRGVMISEGKLTVSKIYEWYGSDFGSNQQQIIDQISKYANPYLKQQLTKFHKIDNYEYNWSLNERH